MSSQDDRLVEILDQFLIDREHGSAPSQSAIIRANPDIREPLREAFSALSLLGGAMMTLDVPKALSVAAPQIDGYELGEELGRGGSGVIYAARHSTTGREVAIKVLAFCAAPQSDRLERFCREATAASMTDHAHIVSMLDFGTSRGIYYYAMNRVDGLSLDRRIAAAALHGISSDDHDSGSNLLLGEGRFERIAGWIADAADGIAHAHSVGVIHRDIKPSNLLLTDDGHVWVADFGLARIGRDAELTRSGDLVGTLRYMSPEQASGRSGAVDERTDIYSLGATLYELVLLRPTFAANDSITLLRHIQTSEPTRPRLLDRSVPKPLEIIIRRAMRRDPSERYVSAGDLAADLRRFAHGEPIEASRVTLAERWTGYARANASQVAGLLFIAFLAASAAVGHALIVSRQQAETRHALAKAETNYRHARRAVDTLGADIAARLESIPGTEELRQEVMAETLGYYELFIANANDDDSLGSDVAQTRLKVAKLVELTGNFLQSDQAYEAAIDDLRGVAGLGEPSTSRLVQAIVGRAMLNSEHGNHDLAMALLNESVDIAQRAMSRNNSDRSDQPRISLALALNNRGVVAIRRGEKELATQSLHTAVALLDDLGKSNFSSDYTIRRDLAAAMGNLAVLLAEVGEVKQAAMWTTRSLEINQSLPNSLDGTPLDIRRRALAHHQLASLHWRAGDYESSIDAYQRAIEMLDRVLLQMPNLVGPRRELSVALNNHAMALSSVDRAAEAEASFRRAIALSQPTAEADPRDVGAARQCSGLFNNLGVLLRKQTRTTEAKQCFKTAIDYQSRAERLSPRDPENHRFLDQIRYNFASLDG